MASATAAAGSPAAVSPAGLAWWARFGPAALALGVVVAAVTVAAVRPVADPDLWWHLETGRWILAHGAVPGQDLYTFTAVSRHWTDHEWLSQVLIALLFRWGGFTALSLGFGLIAGLGVLCLVLAGDGFRRPYPVVAAVAILTVLAVNPALGARPQVITFALAALTALWVRRFLAGRGRAIRALPLVMLAWVNLHGGFVVGFAFLGLALLVECARWWRDPAGDGGRALHRRRALELAVVTALSGVATLANPNGAWEWWYALTTQSSPAQQALIAEWQSPDFHLAFLKPLEALIVAVPLSFAIRRPNLYDGALCLLTLAMCLQSERHSAFLAIAAAPVLMESGGELWRRAGGGRSPRRAARPALAALTGLVLLAGGVGLSAYVAALLGRQDAVTAAQYPAGAADWLAAHPASAHRTFNSYAWGGYLVYRFYPDPDRRVFVFGEADLMGDSLLSDYSTIEKVQPGWRQELDDFGVDAVLMPKGSSLGAALAGEPGWRLGYSDAVSVIYLRS